MIPKIQCYNKCPDCGVVPYKNYVTALGLTPKQQEVYSKTRRTCSKCGGEAKPLNLDQIRRLGLDGCEGYEAPTENLLSMMKGKA